MVCLILVMAVNDASQNPLTSHPGGLPGQCPVGQQTRQGGWWTLHLTIHKEPMLISQLTHCDGMSDLPLPAPATFSFLSGCTRMWQGAGNLSSFAVAVAGSISSLALPLVIPRAVMSSVPLVPQA